MLPDREKVRGGTDAGYVAPNFHPVAIRVRSSLLPGWAGEARGCIAQARLACAGIGERGAGAVHLCALFDQTVLHVIEIDTAPVRGEIAIGIMAERGRPRERVLVEAVG